MMVTGSLNSHGRGRLRINFVWSQKSRRRERLRVQVMGVGGAALCSLCSSLLTWDTQWRPAADLGAGTSDRSMTCCRVSSHITRVNILQKIRHFKIIIFEGKQSWHTKCDNNFWCSKQLKVLIWDFLHTTGNFCAANALQRSLTCCLKHQAASSPDCTDKVGHCLSCVSCGSQMWSQLAGSGSMWRSEVREILSQHTPAPTLPTAGK